jgi:branched-chain amino acid transport system substrate-binding protein
MSKHILVATAIAIAMVNSPAHSEDIVIGAPNSITGGFAEASVRAVAGLQLAIDKINADGGIKALGGAKLKAIVVDTSDSNPTQAATVTRRLIAEDKAVILFGSGASSMTLSTQVEAERAEVPLISPSYADPIVQRGYKYTFKIPIQASQGIDRALGYLVDLLKAETGTAPKTMSVFSGSDAASQATHKVIEDIAKKHDMSVTTMNSYQQGLSDPTAIISAARGNPADVIYLSATTDDFPMIVRALRGVGLKAPILTAGGALFSDQTGKGLGKDANGVIGIDHWNSDLSIPGTADIVSAFAKSYPQYPSPPASEYVGMGYSAGLIIGQALEKAASADPKKLRDVIASTEFSVPMPGGKIAFDETGLNRTLVPIMVSWVDGRLRTVWPKEFQTTKPVLK